MLEENLKHVISVLETEEKRIELSDDKPRLVSGMIKYLYLSN